MQGILGHQEVIDALQAAVAGGRTHHAWIFHGPEGVGKFTTAVAFAKLLLCHQPQTQLTGQVEACGECVSCRQFRTEGGHLDSSGGPDFHVVNKELARYSNDASVRQRKLTQVPVDVLRSALLEPVYRAAQLGRGKVFVVDQAELISPTGQNLLLKTLEEPPAGTFIILVTASEDKLLPTIRSRCHRLRFGPLADGLVNQWLSKNHSDLTADRLDWLTRFAQGSLGRASLAIAYDLAAWADQILPAMDDMARGGFVHDLGALMAERIDAFAQAWVQNNDNASKEAANHQAAAMMFSMLATHCRGRLAQIASVCVGIPQCEAEARLGPYVGCIDALTHAQRDLASNVNLALVCDHLVSEIHRCFQPALAVGVVR